MALDPNMLKNKAGNILSGFSMGQRVVVGIAVLMLVGGGIFFAQWAAKPNMVPLYSNLSSEDASQITTQLQSKKVAYSLDNGGSTILVPESQVYQTRLDLAGQNLPSGGSDGYKLLDKTGITTSDFLQHVDYQRALEGELAKTIGSINGVSAATVHLVIPAQDVFAADSTKPSASVLVKTQGNKTLSQGQVKSVTNLVASAVQGLDASNVTVADGNGKTLAAPGQGADAAGGDESQRQQTQSLQDDLSTKIQNMLTPVVGQGKAVVQARAELNFDTTKSTSQVYNPNNKPATPLSQRSSSETYGSGGGAQSTGILGTSGSALNQSATGGGSGPYSKTDAAQDNGVDQTVTETQKAPGGINRVSVAVLLDSNVANVDTNEVEKLVTQAAGLQPARGDTVTVSRMPFDNSQANADAKALKDAEAEKSKEQTMGLIKTGATVAIVLIVLAILFFVTKKRAGRYSAPQPLSYAELEEAMPELPGPNEMKAALPRPDDPAALERAKVDSEITDLIERQPDEVASLLRNWLADRRS